MSEILTDDIIIDALEQDGFMSESDANWILEYIATEYGGNLDNTSSWAQGREGLLVYTESTADSYDVYACTSEHNGPKDFSSDIYYYADHQEFAERILDTLVNNQNVWVAEHVWDEIEDDFNYELEQWWSEIFDEMIEDKKDELLDSGNYKEE